MPFSMRYHLLAPTPVSQWVNESLIVSDLEIAIASPSFASLFPVGPLGLLSKLSPKNRMVFSLPPGWQDHTFPLFLCTLPSDVCGLIRFTAIYFVFTSTLFYVCNVHCTVRFQTVEHRCSARDDCKT